MMRVIEKYAVLEALCKLRDNAIKWVVDCKEQRSAMTPRAEQAVLTFNECISQVKKASEVDAVEVVRCKDCRWHEREQPGMVYCPNTVGNWVENDWYCKGGERREDDTN